ncbi:MAG: SsrA-binding protein SmpB [Planctomycetota bacterium]|nr:MAG: SsrA-binding protein SmpB [Planctomycetota bacterium]
MKKGPESGRKIIARNKKARFKFHIMHTYEAGLVLEGWEVKSLREGSAQITEAYARFRGGEVFLIGATFDRYDKGGYAVQDTNRPRKLLLHKREIRQLRAATDEKGCTLVPLSLYFSRGLAKIELAVVKGKKLHDKRQDIRKRDAKREVDRELRRKNKRK